VLAGVAAVFVFAQFGSAAPRAAGDANGASIPGSAAAFSQVTATMHRDAASLETRTIQRATAAARRKHLAALAAARRARQRAASHPPSPSPTPAPSSGGGDAASSPLGICIRKAEEGGSYAWGPGNGGGAYQFLLSTWEHYGGAASEFGVAGPAYQDRIFDNAIAAGGASNWTNYDGC
jgi:hypothetical protein